MIKRLFHQTRFAFSRVEPKYTKLFINNEWVDAEDDRTFDIKTPIDESIIATLARAGPRDSEKAIKAAREAFDNPKVFNKK
jgi:acyl-CoA reductase-like NAD-dependent aldehyde dehydrogenase